MPLQSKPQSWKYFANFHIDLIISIVLTIGIYSIRIIFNKQPPIDYGLFITIFIGVFSVNFTVFAISKYLVKNYPKIEKQWIKENIDAVFRTPIKNSVIGAVASIFFKATSITFLDFVLYFFLFYSLISSYYVFKFVYEISIQKGNE